MRAFTLRLVISLALVAPCYLWQACLWNVTGHYLVDVAVSVISPNMVAGYVVHSWVPKGWLRVGLVAEIGCEKENREGEIMDLREVIKEDASSDEGEDEGVGLLKKI
jgi:hypothetical protein